MEVIAVIMAAMASLRRNLVMPILAWKLCKMASKNRQNVEIDVERLTGAVRIRFEGSTTRGQLPVHRIELGRRGEMASIEGKSSPAPELATRRSQRKRPTSGKK